QLPRMIAGNSFSKILMQALTHCVFKVMATFSRLTGNDTRAPGIPIALSPGQSVKNITVTLNPAGNVSGRTRDTNGEALVNVPVQLLKYSYNSVGQRVYQAAGAVRTNDRGEYRIYWVTPGRYYIRAGSAAAGADPFATLIASIFGGGANGNTAPATLGY